MEAAGNGQPVASQTKLIVSIESCTAERPTCHLKGSREKYVMMAQRVREQLVQKLPANVVLELRINEP